MNNFKLKIGRYTYTITSRDTFMDNGWVVQLMTQSNEPSCWGQKPDPQLSKRAIKEIGKFSRLQRLENPILFRLDLANAKG